MSDNFEMTTIFQTIYIKPIMVSSHARKKSYFGPIRETRFARREIGGKWVSIDGLVHRH